MSEPMMSASEPMSEPLVENEPFAMPDDEPDVPLGDPAAQSWWDDEDE